MDPYPSGPWRGVRCPTQGCGLAAGPLAGTVLGAILWSAAVGAAVGAVSGAAIYTGFTLATGGTWSLEAMAQATAVGALIGGVTAGAGKAFELARAGELFGEEAAGSGIQYTQVSQSEIDQAIEGTGIENQPESLAQGNGAHLVIENRAVAGGWPEEDVEASLPRAGPNGGTGRVDLLDRANNVIYEIKPFHPGVSPVQEYAAQIARYSQAYLNAYGVQPTIRFILYTVVP